MALDFSGWNTLGQGLNSAIGSFADLTGLSGKAQALADLRATLGGKPQPSSPLQTLGGMLKNGWNDITGQGAPATDGRAIAGQTLAGLSAPQTAPSAPAKPGYGSNGLPDATNFGLQRQGVDTGTTVPMAQPYAKAAASPGLSNVALDPAKARMAIQGIESGGNSQAVGPMTTYKDGRQDRPYGADQVMGANIPVWTKQYYGRALTPQEFLADPAAQAAVFNGEFGRLAAKYGPEGAAQAWLGGEGSVGKLNRADVNGTTVGDYGKTFAQAYGNGAAAPAQGGQGDATGAVGAPQAAAAPAASQSVGANIPTEALLRLYTNPNLPSEDKALVGNLLQMRMPQPKQYGFQVGPDGTLYRTNATTGEAGVAAQGGPKPTNDQQEYSDALKQGYKGTLRDWIVGNKQAAATKVDINNTQEGALASSLGAAAGKMFGGMIEDGNNAKVDLAQIDVLRNHLAQVPAGIVGGIQGLAQDWGLNIGKNSDDVQVVKAVLAKLVPSQRIAGAGTTSDRDLVQFQNALPKLTGTPGGNSLILDTMQAMAQYKQAQADIASRLAAGEFRKPDGQPDAAAAFKELRALPDPMTAWKANRAAVLAGQPYASPQQGAASGATIAISSEADYQKLPPGTQYIAPDGSTRVKQ